MNFKSRHFSVSLMGLTCLFLVACATPQGQTEGITAPAGPFSKFVKSDKIEGQVKFTQMTRPDENLDNWTELLTSITLRRTLVGDYQQAAQGLTEEWTKSCGPSSLVMSKTYQENGRSVTELAFRCHPGASEPKKTYEYTRLKIMDSVCSLFVVQRTWHGDTPASVYRSSTSAEAKEWDEMFKGMHVETNLTSPEECGPSPPPGSSLIFPIINTLNMYRFR